MHKSTGYMYMHMCMYSTCIYVQTKRDTCTSNCHHYGMHMHVIRRLQYVWLTAVSVSMLVCGGMKLAVQKMCNVIARGGGGGGGYSVLT